MCFSWRRSSSPAARSCCGTHGGQMKDLKGKVAAVTGAASGLGRAMALAFADEGMNVALADVSDLGETLAEVERRRVSAVAMKIDVSKAEDVEAFAALADKDLGGAHVV